jgi:hypothetical protein
LTNEGQSSLDEIKRARKLKMVSVILSDLEFSCGSRISLPGAGGNCSHRSLRSRLGCWILDSDQHYSHPRITKTIGMLVTRSCFTSLVGWEVSCRIVWLIFNIFLPKSWGIFLIHLRPRYKLKAVAASHYGRIGQRPTLNYSRPTGKPWKV